MHGRDRSHGVAQVAAALGFDLAQLALRQGDLHRLNLRRQGADHCGADRELDPQKVRLLGLPAGQHPVGIVRLDPALEKARGHGQLDRIPVAAIELHAAEPTRVNVVTDFGAKTILHARPAVQIHARHCVSLLDRPKPMGERGRNAILRREVARMQET